MVDDFPDIYKLETIGDAYFLVCNLTTEVRRALCVCVLRDTTEPLDVEPPLMCHLGSTPRHSHAGLPCFTPPPLATLLCTNPCKPPPLPLP